MMIRRAFSANGFLILPVVLLVTYWVVMSIRGSEIELPVPAATTFLMLAVMTGLELLYPYVRRVSQRRLLIRDISSTLVNLWGTRVVGAAVFTPVVLFFPEIFLGRSLFFEASSQLGPLWLQLILVIFFYSFMKYWFHRLQHRFSWLWELHAYHHSVTDLRASNTFTSHPLDWALRNVLPPVVLGVVGFNPTAIVFGVGLLGLFGTFSHCGAGLHAGWLNHVFVTPEVHRWHHSAEVPKGHRFSVNYGVGFVVWDRIFGTYYLPSENGVPLQPERLGHPDGVRDESNYLKLFFLTRHLPRLAQLSKG